MRIKEIIILFFILCSCKSNNNSLIEIDPMDFHEEEIYLSKIADDISYIKLDNEYLLGLINSYKIVNKKIYLQAKDIGLLIYDKNGRYNYRKQQINFQTCKTVEEYIKLKAIVLQDTN